MARYRHNLPQLSSGIYLTDAGLETDMIFNHGFELPAFASHTLLESDAGRQGLRSYFAGFLELASEYGTGFILDAPTWRAQRWFAEELRVAPGTLKTINEAAVAFVARLRQAYDTSVSPIVLNACLGPRGDGYSPDAPISADVAEAYHSEQIGWLAETEIDMITALTFNQSEEAIGAVRAAKHQNIPIVVSFTVETDGRLPSGQSLKGAIEDVETATGGAPAYYMVNCAHPDHFAETVSGQGNWTRRIRGFRCNASRCSHAELDNAEVLDDGDPEEMGALNLALRESLPWANVFGGCCGSDLRHVAEIAKAIGVARLLPVSVG